MSDNSHVKDSRSSHISTSEAKSHEAASLLQNTLRTTNASRYHEENGTTTKDNTLNAKDELDPSKATVTETIEAPLNSNPTSHANTKEANNENNRNENEPKPASTTPSTYEIDGITYQYDVAYPGRQPPADEQIRPGWGVYPNMMSYVDDAGVKHEIHIPTGMYHRAVQLFVAKDWNELGKFPAYEGQKYTEADWYRLDEEDQEGGKRDED